MKPDSHSNPGRMKFLLAIAALSVAGCASLYQPLPLPEPENEIVSALLLREAKHAERPRPILVLATTDPFLPVDFDAERPPEISKETWRSMEVGYKLPAQFRAANKRKYNISSITLPESARLYSAEAYERNIKSQAAFALFVKDLGGLEPLVLRVSRPWVDPSGERALIVLHVDSTWSGCGGIDLFEATRVGKHWRVELKDVLVVW